MTKNDSISWADIMRLGPKIKPILWALPLLLVADISISLATTLVLDDEFYFRNYVSETYDDKVDSFFQDRYYVQPHEEVGWVNSPNYRSAEWQTDSHGAQLSSPKTHDTGPSDVKSEGLVLLLGSSVISGYSLERNETPAYHLARSGHNLLDFGTILYSIDQVFSLYEDELSKHSAKTLVVGIHNDPEVISSMFPPWRNDNVSSPFLKPAYFWTEGELSKVLPPVEYQRLGDINSMLSELEKHDPQYKHFRWFKRLSLMPFSDVLRRGVLTLDRNLLNAESYTTAFKLQEHFMRKLVALAQTNSAKVLFVKLESLHDQRRPLRQRVLGSKNELHNKLLKQTSLNVLFASEVFAKANIQPHQLYVDDDPVHLSPVATKLLASAISQEIHKLTGARPAPAN